jgi:hypothetical protein
LRGRAACDDVIVTASARLARTARIQTPHAIRAIARNGAIAHAMRAIARAVRAMARIQTHARRRRRRRTNAPRAQQANHPNHDRHFADFQRSHHHTARTDRLGCRLIASGRRATRPGPGPDDPSWAGRPVSGQGRPIGGPARGGLRGARQVWSPALYGRGNQPPAILTARRTWPLAALTRRTAARPGPGPGPGRIFGAIDCGEKPAAAARVLIHSI